jgi:hypothetical protein
VPDVQHAKADRPRLEPWRRAVVAGDGSHHLLDGLPLYAPRFEAVQKFHAPGLAPARDGGGAYHIDSRGRPAYAARFRQTWGFYEDLAAAEDGDGWTHVRPDGSPLCAARLAWVGNFQEARCTVRDGEGWYFHIDREGRPAYAERHRYAGDFRDGAAVVRYEADGLCGHVDGAGRPTHAGRFIDLDVYHKGYARARDARGWLHVDRSGRAAYRARFAAVEPFYNGQALGETPDGRRVLIDVAGAVVLSLDAPR